MLKFFINFWCVVFFATFFLFVGVLVKPTFLISDEEITKYQITCELAEGKREINFTDVVKVYPSSTTAMSFKLGNGIVVSMHGYKCMVLKYTATTEE